MHKEDKNMATPHNSAEVKDIARIVLMPGDPLRAKYIAEKYLEDYQQVNTVRNMFAYTGFYKGMRISVMGSGMGMASIGIYSYELFQNYDVDTIIRIGSAGSYCAELNIFDVVVANSAWSESSFAYAQANVKDDVMKPDAKTNEIILETAKELSIDVKEKRIHSSDVFYHENNVGNFNDFYEHKQCACVEMESFALFHNANVLGKHAACILTISDSFVSKQEVSAKQRETSFDQMMVLALEACRKIHV